VITTHILNLHNEKLRNLYTSSNISRVIKSRRMRWAVHVARMGEMRKPEGEETSRKM